jgi:hypothetical protein
MYLADNAKIQDALKTFEKAIEDGAMFRMKCDRYVPSSEENVEENTALPAVSSSDPPEPEFNTHPLTTEFLDSLLTGPNVWKEIEDGKLVLVDKKSRVFRTPEPREDAKNYDRRSTFVRSAGRWQSIGQELEF